MVKYKKQYKNILVKFQETKLFKHLFNYIYRPANSQYEHKPSSQFDLKQLTFDRVVLRKININYISQFHQSFIFTNSHPFNYFIPTLNNKKIDLLRIIIHLQMNRVILVFVAVTAALLLIREVANMSQSSDFEQWKLKYQPEFKNAGEEFYRKMIFETNQEKIQQHNTNTQSNYKMGPNQFTIYTEQQFEERFLNPKIVQYNSHTDQSDHIQAVIIDWTQQGAVSPVKNQGICGGAAIYGTLGGVEGLSKVSTGTLKVFSQQQLIDCVYGCTGGMATSGYTYYKTHGVCTKQQYPTTSHQDACKTISCAFKISGYTTVNNCADLATSIQKQPVSVAVDATKWSTYASGIFNNCGTSLNHFVVLTGMADQYWKCKNSWGTSWGEQGYIRLARGNTCGICNSALYPLK